MVRSAGITLYIDPFSHHFLKDLLFDIGSDEFGGDKILAPYVYLREWFASRGVRVRTADWLAHGQDRSTVNVYMSLGMLDRYRTFAKREDVILSAFFAFEGPIVEPSLYLELAEVERYFKRLYSFSDSVSLSPFVRRPIKCQHFHIPQCFDSIHETIWHRGNRHFLVMINGNKLPRLYVNELYTERLRAVEYFSRTGDIDLYGVGWDGPPYRMGKALVPATVRRVHRSLLQYWQRFRPDPLYEAARRVYRGPTRSKAETLGKYTFALCFENQILSGWVTEKIFDCFFAGTIPIYLGAPDIETYVPRRCFVDMREFASYKELRTYLKSLSEEDVRDYRENARDYLRSPQFQPFSKKAFAELVGRIVQEDTGVELLQQGTEAAVR
jgi:hypothetical protein